MRKIEDLIGLLLLAAAALMGPLALAQTGAAGARVAAAGCGVTLQADCAHRA